MRPFSKVSQAKQLYSNARTEALKNSHYRFLFNQLLGEYAYYMSEYANAVISNNAFQTAFMTRVLMKLKDDFKKLLLSFGSNAFAEKYNPQTRQGYVQISNNLMDGFFDATITNITRQNQNDNDAIERTTTFLYDFFYNLSDPDNGSGNGYYNGPEQKKLKHNVSEFVTCLAHLMNTVYGEQYTDKMYHLASVFINRAKDLGSLLDEILE